MKTSTFKFESTRQIGKSRDSITQLNITEQIGYNNFGELDLRYGFKAHFENCTAKDPGMPRENYRLHSSIHPRKGDKLTHVKSGRVFTFGEPSGFVVYTIPLLENGKQVAIVHFEDYYKD